MTTKYEQAEEAMIEDARKNDFPDRPAWEPEEPGDKLIGDIIEITRDITIQRGTPKEQTVDLMIVRDRDGQEWELWISSSVLIDKISRYEPWEVGDVIAVGYQGRERSKKGFEYKLFCVGTDRDPDERTTGVGNMREKAKGSNPSPPQEQQSAPPHPDEMVDTTPDQDLPF